MSRQSYEYVLDYILTYCNGNVNSVVMEYVNIILSEYPYN